MQNRRFQGEKTQIDRIKSVQIAITATSVFSGRKMLKVSYLSNELTHKMQTFRIFKYKWLKINCKCKIFANKFYAKLE